MIVFARLAMAVPKVNSAVRGNTIRMRAADIHPGGRPFGHRCKRPFGHCPLLPVLAAFAVLAPFIAWALSLSPPASPEKAHLTDQASTHKSVPLGVFLGSD